MNNTDSDFFEKAGPSSSFLHVVVEGFIKNSQEEVCIFHRDAHWRFDAEDLRQKEERKKNQIIRSKTKCQSNTR